MELTREQVEAAYDLGREAVVELVLGLSEQLRAQALQLTVQAKQIAELQERLGKNSRNSHKPPSSDGFKRRTVSNRESSGRPSGGQIGHPGQTLAQVTEPDWIEPHRPETCKSCGESLAGIEGAVAARRQVFELPAKLYEVIEHQAITVACPHCQCISTGRFPENVTQAAQYGEGLKGWMVYLQTYQLLPYGRTQELIADTIGLEPSEGTLRNVQSSCANGLEFVAEAIKEAIIDADVIRCDETGGRVGKKLEWLHVAGTPSLTHYAVHPKRGPEAMIAIDILPRFKGTMIHDAMAGYFQFGERHGLCNAHLLRELKAIFQNTGQTWAQQMRGLLVEIKEAVEAAVARGESALPDVTLRDFTDRYRKIIAEGHRVNPLPVQTKTRGRLKRTPPGNLVLRMDTHQDAVLLFMHDFNVPFDNNLSERDLRMMKVKTKVSGCFRSRAGASDFCRIRGYISTLRKQGLPVLEALTSVFAGNPTMPALR